MKKNLAQLIQIGIGIGAGCIPCTKMLVKQAIEDGCTKEEIELVISIAKSLQKSDCFRKSAGDEAVKRMIQPLETAEKILKENDKGCECNEPC